jgi:membrane protease subunit (stomatin/prohibitin family)
MIVSRLGPALATSGVSVLDMAANQGTIGNRIAGVLSEDLANVGLTIPNFFIENISMPPEVEAALDKRTQLGILGGNLGQYTQLQAANAIEDAAKNPGGGAGSGIGLGMGMAVGQQMANQFNPANQQAAAPPAAAPPAAAPPPLPQPTAWFIGVNGQQQGPLDDAGIASAARAGTLTAGTLVWKAGMAAWTPAGQVPELAGVLGSVPPPLPPA